jgi:phosphatidylcholine synthase
MSLRVAGWGVHLYTALGAAIGLAGLDAAARHDARSAFAWLSLAVVIDASDGALARLARVKEILPEFDGSKLDDIVDYLNYVVVPIFLMLQIGILAGGLGMLSAAAAVLASAYRFCHVAAKTPDHFFTGFPSYWNVVAFYLYLFSASPAIGGTITLTLAVLVFAPLRFLYPSRTPTLRPLTLGLGLVWSVLAIILVASLPERRTTLAAISLFYPLYYTLLSFFLQYQGSARRRSPPYAEPAP